MKFRSLPVAAVIDLLAIIVFAAIGRRNHDESAALTGLFHTAWPFVVGGLLGWAITYALYREKFDAFLLLPTGIAVWIFTVVFGMALRAITGQGTAGAFIIVATLSLAVLLLGWRGLMKFVPSVR